MNCLVDTNIFLEILLNQAGRKKCEAFLQGEKGAAWISDFTLHSIGVLLFRQKQTGVVRQVRSGHVAAVHHSFIEQSRLFPAR